MYFGISAYIGSVSAFLFTVIFATAIMIYNKFVEEKELEERFGEYYRKYKERVPFVIPRFRK